MADRDKKEELETKTEDTQEQGSESAPEAKGSETKQPAEYEKTQQQLDQERANRKRIQSAYDQAQAEKEQLVEQVNSLQGQLGELQAQLKQALTKKEFQDLATLDPDTTDVPSLVQKFQAMTAKVAALEDRSAKAEAALAQRSRKEQEDAQANAHRAMEEEVYSMLDEEYGAQFRNEAIKLSDQWIDDHEVDQPTTLPQGIKLLRKAYAEVARKHAKPAPAREKVSTDNGLRGLSHAELLDEEEFKPGTNEQVKADMLKRMKAGKWKKAFATSP